MPQETLNKTLEIELADAIMERPQGFKVARQWLYLYPVSLGKSILLSRLTGQLGLNTEIIKVNPAVEAMRAVINNKEIVCSILAYHTFNHKDEIFDVEKVAKREKLLSENLSDEDLAELLLIVYSFPNANTFISYLGLEKEKNEQRRISKIKNGDGGSVSFGGKSLYGALVDAACERYGWTYDYVVWGISYVSLTLLMHDAINSIYLTKEEQKKARVSTDNTRIKADDPKNRDIIKSMKWD